MNIFISLYNSKICPYTCNNASNILNISRIINCSLNPSVPKGCFKGKYTCVEELTTACSPLYRGTMKSIMQNNCWPTSYISVSETCLQCKLVNAHSSVNIVHIQAEQEWHTSRYMIFLLRHWKGRKSHWAFTKERCCSLSTLPPSEGQQLRRWLFIDGNRIMFHLIWSETIIFLCSLSTTEWMHWWKCLATWILLC